MTNGRGHLAIAAAFCGVVGLYDLLYVGSVFTGLSSVGPRVDVLFPDFLVFHAAARAFLEGKLALVYDIDAFTRFQAATYPDHLPIGTVFRPFFYPPIFLLMLLPLGLLTVGKAFTVFMTVTAALATALAGRRDPWGWLAIVTSPAAVWVVLAGQNTFLSIALLYGGLHVLERSPVAAGVLLGLLSFKPQIWVLVPLALLAARQWRAFGWMAATVAALALASLAVFGRDFCVAFLDAARLAGSPQVAEEMFHRVFMHMTTLLAAARIVGLPPSVAGIVQLAGALLAVAAVWQAFRHHGPGTARTAVLVAATFLVSPYTLNYDLLLLMPVVVALFRLGVVQGFYPGERLVHVAMWLIPTMGMILNRLELPVMPVLILLLGTIAWMRLHDAAKVELPKPATAG